MRIVFVLPHANFTGGVRTVATYARLLSRRGHRVVIVSTPDPLPSLRRRVASFVRGQGWPRHPRVEPSLIDYSGVEHRRLEQFRPVSDRDVPDADAVVATWWLTAEWVAALSPRKGAKIQLVQGHEAELPGQPKERVAATWKLPLRRIVCSRWLQEVAKSHYGDSTTRLVPNGVDLSHFCSGSRGKGSEPTIGFVYSRSWVKGCDIAVRAFEIAASRVPGLRLNVFGNMPIAPNLPLPRRAEFTLLPPEERIPHLYASCDAWLWPSRREGFGLPILEAMACRTPIIATPAGAAPEMLENGGGVLLPTFEPGVMADAIERIVTMSDPEWRLLSNDARSVAARHGWERSVELLEAVLEANGGL